VTDAHGPESLFGLTGKVAVVTGGSGVLGSAMAKGLARAGASVVILARNAERVDRVVHEIERRPGGQALPVYADVLDHDHMRMALQQVLDRWGAVDILVNAAGGNVPAATLSPDDLVFDLPLDAFDRVLALNLTGTLLPTQVFGEAMSERRPRPQGCIINISSMAAQRAVTRVVGYSAAKAAIESLTRWLAVELARKLGDGIRVNAIAPGFFIGEQNRSLLLDQSGDLTERGRVIIDHTPAGRFGEPEELIGPLVWLCSPAASFVNGVVVAVDGGFSAFSGV
jgi:NAD(P)-dependent dehydrogenase (short-subunit alcohol dehydrogenase family)